MKVILIPGQLLTELLLSGSHSPLNAQRHPTPLRVAGEERALEGALLLPRTLLARPPTSSAGKRTPQNRSRLQNSCGSVLQDIKLQEPERGRRLQPRRARPRDTPAYLPLLPELGSLLGMVEAKHIGPPQENHGT